MEPCAPITEIKEDKKPYFPSCFHAIPMSYTAGGHSKTKSKGVKMLQDLDLIYPFVNFFGREPRSVSDGPSAPYSGRGEIIVHLKKNETYIFPEILSNEFVNKGFGE